MSAIRFKGCTKEKISFIYKIIGVLIQSVPFSIQEDVRTELLLLAIDIVDKNMGYIFIALKNKKISILRSPARKNNVLVNSLNLIDICDESGYSNHALQIKEDLNIVLIAYKRATMVEKRYIREAIKYYKNKGEFNNTIISRNIGVGRIRGFHILAKIRKYIGEIRNENKSKLLSDLRNVDDLFRAVQYTRPS